MNSYEIQRRAETHFVDSAAVVRCRNARYDLEERLEGFRDVVAAQFYGKVCGLIKTCGMAALPLTDTGKVDAIYFKFSPLAFTERKDRRERKNIAMNEIAVTRSDIERLNVNELMDLLRLPDIWLENYTKRLEMTVKNLNEYIQQAEGEE